jgi:nickel-type superoxide dismutase maturation protease
MTLPAYLPKPKKLRLLSLRRVVGHSMTPLLKPGRIVLIVRPFRVRQGDIVVVWHDGREKIKRVAQVKDEKIYVVGDNPTDSTDSRHFGWLSIDAVYAKVLGLVSR